MENGSKALIIAGAILLAILIIGLGVYIYNQASNTVSDTGMDQIAIRQFNAQFEPYINKTIDSISAKALIDTVNQSNQSGKSRIKLFDISEKSQIITGHKYTVEPDYQSGIITGIGISDTNGLSAQGGGETTELLSVSAEEYNENYRGYVDTITENAQPKEDPHFTLDQVNEMIDINVRCNKTYSHWCGHTLPARFDYSYYTIHASFENGYISNIVVQGWDASK